LSDELKQASSEFADLSTDINVKNFGEKAESDDEPDCKIDACLNEGTDRAQDQIGDFVPEDIQMKVSDQ
tara:strand:+ start:189 stop:395 length:207 start_codon:yes stop_codon:yes gene_type:complete